MGDGLVVGVVVPVRHLLPSVAEHVVQPERVGRKNADGRGEGKAVVPLEGKGLPARRRRSRSHRPSARRGQLPREYPAAL